MELDVEFGIFSFVVYLNVRIMKNYSMIKNTLCLNPPKLPDGAVVWVKSLSGIDC